VILHRDGDEQLARELERAALSRSSLTKAILRVPISRATQQNLPPSLSETIPNLPAVRDGKTCAVVCSNFACQPPLSEPEQLRRALEH
jgi:uncharacterized protein YyaL (SSP411 family)